MMVQNKYKVPYKLSTKQDTAYSYNCKKDINLIPSLPHKSDITD